MIYLLCYCSCFSYHRMKKAAESTNVYSTATVIIIAISLWAGFFFVATIAFQTTGYATQSLVLFFNDPQATVFTDALFADLHLGS